jgi:hypothetical protein
MTDEDEISLHSSTNLKTSEVGNSTSRVYKCGYFVKHAQQDLKNRTHRFYVDLFGV